MAINWPDGLGDIANLGLTLAEAKQLASRACGWCGSGVDRQRDGSRHPIAEHCRHGTGVIHYRLINQSSA
jgi:hypothetical protein